MRDLVIESIKNIINNEEDPSIFGKHEWRLATGYEGTVLDIPFEACTDRELVFMLRYIVQQSSINAITKTLFSENTQK
jgi:hypothetical protein